MKIRFSQVFGGLRTKLLVAAMVAGVTNAKADGSKDMFPEGGKGYRAAIWSSYSCNNNTNPFPTVGVMKVYAKAGEHILLGSSAIGKGSGAIDYYAPDGSSGSFKDKSKGGRIDNRKQELAGPNYNGEIEDGFTPISITVGEGQDGVWEIYFLSPTYKESYNSDESSSKYSIENWSQNNNDGSIMAFDVSVSNESNTELIKGRVFTNVLNVNVLKAPDGVSYAPCWYSTLYVLTDVGYIYRVNTNGQNPHYGAFFSNNKGIQKAGTGAVSENQYVDPYKGKTTGFKNYEGGQKSYQSIEAATETENGYIYDPRLQDNRKRVANADGDSVWMYEDVTHKIFFSMPAADLPESAPAVYGKTVSDTWLKTTSSFDVSPEMSNLTLEGKEVGRIGVLGPEGLAIGFDASVAGDINIDLDFGEGYTPRRIESHCVKGANLVDWDGKDGDGKVVILSKPVQITIGGKLTTAEVHFPFTDLENNESGFILQLLNGKGLPIADYIYWDDTNLQSDATGTDSLKAIYGSSSENGAHKWTKENSTGDDAIVDTWSYVVGTATSSSVMAEMKFIDLAVSEASADKNRANVGDVITYTIKVANNNLENVDFNGTTINADSDADSVAVGVWFANGGFVADEIIIVESDDETCAVLKQPTADENGAGYVSLKNGKTATIQVKGHATPTIAHAEANPKAYIMRPGDIFEIDANNLVDDAAPSDPTKEYEKTENNNIFDCGSLSIYNSAPVAENDTIIGVDDKALVLNVFDNDEDVDSDSLTIEKVLIDGVQAAFGEEITLKDMDGNNAGVIVVAENGTITFTSVKGFEGSISNKIEYITSDGYDGSAKFEDDIVPGRDTANIFINIQENLSPVVSPKENTIYRTGDTTKTGVKVTDPEKDKMTVSLSDEENFFFNPETGEIEYIGQNPDEESKTFDIVVTAIDENDNKTEEPVKVTIKRNLSPIISDTDTDTLKVMIKAEKETDYSQNPIMLPIAIFDPENDIVSTKLTGTDASLFKVENGNVYYFGTTPDSDEDQTYTFTATATDEKGETTTREVLVTIRFNDGTLRDSELAVKTDTIMYGESFSEAIKALITADTAKDGKANGKWIVRDENLRIVEDDEILNAGVYHFDFSYYTPDTSDFGSGVVPTTVVVKPRSLQITSSSAEKEYDGNPLSAASFSIKGDGLYGNDSIIASNFASQTNAGEVENKFDYVFADNVIAENYSIDSLVYGKLKVNAKKLTVDGSKIKETKPYDGTTDCELTEIGTIADGIIGDDDVKIASAVADYEDKNVDTTKSVTIAYTLEGEDAANYYVEDETRTADITPKQLNINGSEVSDKVYDANTDADVKIGTINGLLPNDSVNVVADGQFPSEQAGEKDVVVNYVLSGPDAANYTVAPDTISSEIKPKEVTLDWGNNTFTYDGEEKTLEVALDGVLDGDECKFNVVGNKETEVGSYVAKVTSLENDNYALVSDSTKSWVISVTEISVVAIIEDSSFIYDGTEKKPAVKVMDGDNDITDLCDIVYADNTDAGKATVKVSPKEDSGFVFPELTENFVIEPKPVVISNSKADDKVFDGDNTAIITLGNVDGILEDAKVSVATAGIFSDKNAGQDKDVYVTYELAGEDAKNYKLVNELDTTKASIFAKELVVNNLKINDKDYDGNTEATVSDKGSLDGVVPGTDVTIATVVAAFDNAEVGSHNVNVSFTLDGDDAPNYFIKDTTAVASIRSVDSNFDWVYDAPVYGDNVGQGEEVFANYVGSELADGGQYTYFVDGEEVANDDYVVPGVHNVKVVYTDPNGEKAESLKQPITFGKATLNPIPEITRVKVYDGNAEAIAKVASVEGKVQDGDDVIVSIATSLYDDETVGEGKTIIVTYELSGENADYYTVRSSDSVNDGAIIDNGSLWSIVNPDGLVYGGATLNDDVKASYDAPDANITYVVDGEPLAAGENLPAGKHEIKAIYTDPTTGATTDTTFVSEIAKKELTVDGGASQPKVYDGNTDATLAKMGTLSGIVGDDDVELDSAATVATFADEKVGEGKDVIVDYALAGADADNYFLNPVKLVDGVIYEAPKKTQPAPVLADGVTSGKGMSDGKIGGLDTDMEISADGGNTWSPVTDPDAGFPAGDYLARYPETDSTYASEPAKATVSDPAEKKTQPAPVLADGVTSGKGMSDGKIGGLDTDMEISADGGNTWSPVTDPDAGFPAGDYLARYPETDSTYASEPAKATVSDPIEKKTQPTPALVDGITSAYGYKDGKIGGLDSGMEISDDGGLTWMPVSDPDAGFAAGNYLVRYPETDSTYASEAVSVNVTEPDKGNQPTPLLTNGMTSAPDMADGIIGGLTVGMEISTDGGKTWTPVEDGNKGYPVGEYLVRYSETRTMKPSEAVTVYVFEGVIDMVDANAFTVDGNGYCPETDGQVGFKVKKGEPTYFRAIIEELSSKKITETSFVALSDEGKFSVYIPLCDAGNYNIKVQFRNDNGSVSPVYTVGINVNLSEKYIVNVWDDVVSIVNKNTPDLNSQDYTKRFNAYQWYRDGEKIDGATDAYYNEKGGLDGVYFVEVNTIDNRKLRTCTREWHIEYDFSINVYPNPVKSVATIELSTDNGEAHTISVSSVSGQGVFSDTFKGDKTTFDFSSCQKGWYVIKVDNAQVKVIKE